MLTTGIGITLVVGVLGGEDEEVVAGISVPMGPDASDGEEETALEVVADQAAEPATRTPSNTMEAQDNRCPLAMTEA